MNREQIQKLVSDTARLNYWNPEALREFAETIAGIYLGPTYRSGDRFRKDGQEWLSRDKNYSGCLK